MAIRMGVVTQFLFVLALALLGAGCASNHHVEEGYVDVIGGKIFYRVVSGEKHGTPVIVVPGGPGVPHDYLRSLEELADERPVIFYDPLGCGRSERPTAPQLSIRGDSREINALRDQLELRDVYILSDSWGGVISSEYLLSTPNGVRGVIFSSPVFSGERYTADAERLLDQLPAETRNIIRKHERDGTTGSDDYRDAYGQFFDRFICRNFFKPQAMTEALKTVGMEEYRAMHGPNQIDINGSLRDYDRTGDFWQITQPALVTCGRYDVCTPETAAYFQGRLNKAKLAVFNESSHTPIFEEHEAYMKAIREFMHDHDAR